MYDQIQSLQQMADSLKKQTELAESEAHSAKQETLALQRISDSLQEQTDLARAEAHSAKIDAAFSKIFSVISLIISIAAILVPQLFG